MPLIKNIIFDFGNVLFDLDLQAVYRKMQILLGDHFESARTQLRHNRIFELYETGGLSTEEFIDTLRNSAPVPLTAAQIVDAWNSIFREMPRERFDLLLRLRQQYQVFLLSNINDLHAAWIDRYMLEKHQLSDFQTRYFDAVYYSHLIRLRKPDRAVYEYVLADAEINPEETLFIDDLEENVSAARRLGILGIVKTDALQIEPFIRGLLEG